jgi:hypothetical protein
MANLMRTSAILLCMARLRFMRSMPTMKCPFALEDGARLAPMAAKLVDRLSLLVAVRRFSCMVLPTLVLC